MYLVNISLVGFTLSVNGAKQLTRYGPSDVDDDVSSRPSQENELTGRETDNGFLIH